MAAQSHPVDAVPGLHGVAIVKLLAGALEDHVDAGVGVVHEHVQPTRLLGGNFSKQLLHI